MVKIDLYDNETIRVFYSEDEIIDLKKVKKLFRTGCQIGKNRNIKFLLIESNNPFAIHKLHRILFSGG